MAKNFFVPPQKDDQPNPKRTLLRARTGPIRMRKSGAGKHAQGTARERTRGQNESADIRRSLDGER